MTVDNAGLRRMTRFGAVHYGQPVVERIIEAAQELASQTGAREFTAKLGDIEWGALMDQEQTSLRRPQPVTLIVVASAGPVTCSRDDTCEGISVQPITRGEVETKMMPTLGDMSMKCNDCGRAALKCECGAHQGAGLVPNNGPTRMCTRCRKPVAGDSLTFDGSFFHMHCVAAALARVEPGEMTDEQLIAELQRRPPAHAAMLEWLSGDELRAELKRRGGPGRDDGLNFATDDQLRAECQRRDLDVYRAGAMRAALMEYGKERDADAARDRKDFEALARERDEWKHRAGLAETKVTMADAAKASARRERDEIQADFKKLAELKSPMPRHLLEAELLGPDGTLRLARERAEEAERFRDSQGAKIDSMRSELAAVREELRVAKLDLAGGSSYATRPRAPALCDLATAVGFASACRCAPTCEKFKCWCSCGWSCTGFPTIDEASSAVDDHRDAAAAGVQTPSAPQVSYAPWSAHEDGTCRVCHAPPGKCTPTCENDAVPDAKVEKYDPEALQVTFYDARKGDRLPFTQHPPEENPMLFREGMTEEDFIKAHGRAPQRLGEDIVCRCCKRPAPRKVGVSPRHTGVGLVADNTGWLIYVFPLQPYDAVVHETTNVCPTCAPRWIASLEHLAKVESGEDAVLDDDLLCADV